MHSVDEWTQDTDGRATGTMSMEIEGAPVSIDGTVTLTPDGDTTAYAVTIDVDVRVPLVGRKIAEWAMRDVDRQFGLQFEAADEWLASHRP